jgi:beta-lactamase regulating signal transducer with metallopeptidase domain/HEAT repeat protein
MIRVSEFVLNFLLNSLWQIPAICMLTLASAYLLKNCAAQYRHVLWVVALALCLIAPLVSAAGFRPAFPSSKQASTPVASRPVAAVPHASTAEEMPALNRSASKSRQIEINATPKVIQLTVVGYALFILLCSVRLARQWIANERLKASVTDVGLPIRVETTAMYCRTLLQLKNVSVVRSEMACVPCTLGVRRPLIVLPDSFCDNADDETLLSVIAHEMTHVQRRDFLTKLMCECVSLPISFHPFNAFIKRQIERERELSCDELVTRRAVVRETYARSLLTAADLAIVGARYGTALSIFDGMTLEKRIKRLIENRIPLSRPTARRITVSVVSVVCLSTLVMSAFAFELRAKLNTLSPIMPVVVGEQPLRLDPSIEVAARSEQQARKELEVPNPQVRAQAACAAGRKRDLEAIPTLIAMLSDDSQTESVLCWEGGRWTPALNTFKHASPGEEAALALASMGRAALPSLVNQLDNSNATARRNAAWAIGELTNMLPAERSSATTGLVALLNDADAWVRMASARALGELRDLRATESLIVTLLDSDWQVRQMAAWALSELKDDRAVKALGNVLLSDSRPEVRRIAAEALGEIRSNEALPFLRQAVNDSEAAVSAKAHWAIAEIEGTDGLP